MATLYKVQRGVGQVLRIAELFLGGCLLQRFLSSIEGYVDMKFN